MRHLNAHSLKIYIKKIHIKRHEKLSMQIFHTYLNIVTSYHLLTR